MKHTELIERLRAGSGGMKHWQELESEAADAIEALQSTLARIEEKVDYLIAERDALKLDAERYLEKLIQCRSSVKIAANEFDRFMVRKQPNANQCDIDEQKRLHDLLDWIDTAMKGAA